MNAIDIAVIVVVSVAIIAVAALLIYRKVKHKGGCCDCGCKTCPHCDKCNTKK